MRELEYPFDSEYLLKKSKKIKRELMADGTERMHKRIAVLGGSTTHDIIRMLELFLLDQGIEASFYESEYGQYFQDAMFGSPQLLECRPDLIYVHTSRRNITGFPHIADSKEQVEALLSKQYGHFETMWDRLKEQYHCPVIQNNFEYPFYRLLGNKDASDMHGQIRFITRLNERFYEYAENHESFYINDINYMAAAYGLDRWADPFYWHMYKYCMCLQAIPEFAFNLSHMIKAVFGKNKKALALDLDNTLWGGIVGDDGPENLEIGPETSQGQVYVEFQSYLKSLKEIGVILNVNSKNEPENALAGLKHPAGILKPEDFLLIKANWEPKSRNMAEIAKEMNILPESLVFVDDNPAEREIVRAQTPGAGVPEMGLPEQYIRVLDHSGFFEVTQLSEDDRKRNEMYQANRLREQQQESFADYTEYLLSLEMKGTIRAFEPVYMARIAQLTNKSNQFNLTTRRYTQDEIERLSAEPGVITLYGKLEDKFGDNGVVSLVIGHREDDALHVDLWLMSCRVLKRDMEYAMMDRLVEECQRAGIQRIVGYYYPTARNGMVKEFYGQQGFTKKAETQQAASGAGNKVPNGTSVKGDASGNSTVVSGDPATVGSVWEFVIPERYEKKNKVIAVCEA